ncbi:hypothetical protein CspHIS471_0200520 [Cutaneotrichosporon sp. HIS471]|nr:hypothetical protein CspHIS471_0200520 [Cutaneotrichosporon sp. HIS471]
MKLVLLPLLAALAHAAPTRQEDGDDGVISLDLTFNSPPLVDGVPEIIHKAANVPHHVPPFWLVGDSFLKNVYSVFQWKPARVGFAELRV